MKFWYAVQLIKLNKVWKFNQMSFSCLLFIIGQKTIVWILRYDHTQHQWFSLTTSNSEMDDCSESLVRIKSLVHKIAAVNINHYVRMSIMISFCPIDFKKHLHITLLKKCWGPEKAHKSTFLGLDSWMKF